MTEYITLERYQLIKNKYQFVSSWAIWEEYDKNKSSKEGMNNISFFENPSDNLLKKLNVNIIFVGENISKPIERSFGNFHPDYKTAHDYKLRYALQDTIMWGSYITDIIKGYEEIDGMKVLSYLKKNPEIEKNHISLFKEELNDIGSVNPILIALGNNSYEILERNFKNIYQIFKISHYSSNKSKEIIKDEIENIIRKIGN